MNNTMGAGNKLAIGLVAIPFVLVFMCCGGCLMLGFLPDDSSRQSNSSGSRSSTSSASSYSPSGSPTQAAENTAQPGAAAYDKEIKTVFARKLAEYETSLKSWEESKHASDQASKELPNLQGALVSLESSKPQRPIFQQRTWRTSDKKHSLLATLADIDEGSVTLSKSDGSTVTGIEMEKLIAEDRIYLSAEQEKMDAYRSQISAWTKKYEATREGIEAAEANISTADVPKPKRPEIDSIANSIRAKRDLEKRQKEKAAADLARAEAARTLNAETWLKVRPGMTYSEVVAIIGPPDSLLSETDIGGYHSTMYMWKGGLIANANATFQNGKLVSKAQFGL